MIEIVNTQLTVRPKKYYKKRQMPIYHEITVNNPLWVSISEAAMVCGITPKTVRRGIHNHQIKYKITKNRYLVDLGSVIAYLHKSKKLLNKLNFHGIGQYITGWK